MKFKPGDLVIMTRPRNQYPDKGLFKVSVVGDVEDDWGEEIITISNTDGWWTADQFDFAVMENE